MLSLNATVARFTPDRFPTIDVLIAPFWADADTTPGNGTGHVYYGSTSNSTVLNRAAQIINTAFTRPEANFTPEHLYVVTWLEVGYFGYNINDSRVCKGHSLESYVSHRLEYESYNIYTM